MSDAHTHANAHAEAAATGTNAGLVAEPHPSQHPRASASSDWPPLPYSAWADTLATLHRWTQIVGKVRMELSPWINHSWSVPLYVGVRGLGTGPITYGPRLLELDFDFIDHDLVLRASDGTITRMALHGQSVASFHDQLLATLADTGIDVRIHPQPNEIPDAIPFPQDTEHASYDPTYANDFWRALVQSHRVFNTFRARFVGKSSPVHFFWGSFDLAVTRFSGATAPIHPGGFPNLPDAIAIEAYSHEVISAGFWPGNDEAPDAMFYAYAYPTPPGLKSAKVQPNAASWLDALGEFVLPYDAVRTSNDPDATLTDFLQSTYEAAADLMAWNRDALERPAGWHPLGVSGSI